MKIKLILSLLIASAIQIASAQTIDPTRLDSVFYEGWKSFKEESGVAIGVMHHGELVYAKGFGKNHLDSAININEFSVFPVASISKAFTATLLAKVIEDNDFSWNTKVKDVYPEFDLYDNYVENHMTLKDILNHRNGYKTFDGDLLWYYTDYSAEEALKRFAKLPPNQNFRDQYGYQNTMFMVAALIVEKYMETSWSAAVQNHIFDPLEMRHSTSSFEGHQHMKSKVYPVLNRRSYPISNFDNAKGAVGVNSCVNDLAIWMQYWLDDNDERIISKANKKALSSMHLVTSDKVDKSFTVSGVGLGWFVGERHENKMVSHSGGLPGYIHHLVWYPQLNSGVIALSNGVNYLPFAVTNYVGELFFDNHDPAVFNNYSEAYSKNRAKDAEATQKLLRKKPLRNNYSKDYLGKYEDAIFGKAKVERIGGLNHLTFEFADRVFSGPLVSQSVDQFIWEHKDPFLAKGSVKFKRDFEGNLVSFEVNIHNHDFHFGNMEFIKK